MTSASNPYFGRDHITVVKPTRGWRLLPLRELWEYRELLRALAVRDLRVRYKQTVLGVAWAIIQPLVLMAIFSFFFGRLARFPSGGVPYPVFVFSALVPWTFFSSSVSASALSLVESAHLVSKVYFPRIVVPLASIGSLLVDLAISTAILLGMLRYFGVAWTPNLLLAPLVIGMVVVLALGIGTFLCALTVTYRDFRYVVPVLLQTWMFATPVAYPESVVPDRWLWLLRLNPMTGLIDAARSAFLGWPIPWDSLAWASLPATALLLIGLTYFDRVERRFADLI